MQLIEKFIKILPKNKFVRNVSVLAGGAAVGQGIVVLASPILTRIYSPADFGLLAVYTSLLMITGVISSLRYQLAIPLPKSDYVAADLVVLCLIINAGISLLLLLIVFFFKNSIALHLNNPIMGRYLWLLPIGLFLWGVYRVFNFWAIRIKAFPIIAKTKLKQSFAMVGVQIVFSMFGPVALLIGHIAGKAAGMSNLGVMAVLRNRALYKRVTRISIRDAAARYKRFPIYSTWGAVLNTSSNQLPSLLFAVLFNSTIAGYYMLAQRVLASPMALIGGAVGDVFFSNAAEAKRNGTLNTLVATVYNKLAHIAMPPAMLLLVAGPELFEFVFGPEWKVAGHFAQIMAPWIYFGFVTSPLSLLFPALEKQTHEIFFQGLLFVVRTSALVFGAAFWNIDVTIYLFSIGSVVCYLCVLIWELRISGNNWKSVWQPSLFAFLLSMALLSPLIIAKMIHLSPVFWWGAFVISVLLISIRYIKLYKTI